MERNTQQRQALLAVFKKASRPLSINEIHAAAKVHCARLGIATVYRNLKALIAEEKLVSIDMPGGTVLYELPGNKHHHHFSCLNCQKVFDVDACGLNLQRLTPPGFTLMQHEILLSGLCRDCAVSG